MLRALFVVSLWVSLWVSLSASPALADVTCNDGTVGSGPEGCRSHGGVRNQGIRCRDGATSRRGPKDACANHGGVGSPDSTPPKMPNPARQRNGDPDPRRDPIGNEP